MAASLARIVFAFDKASSYAFRLSSVSLRYAGEFLTSSSLAISAFKASFDTGVFTVVSVSPSIPFFNSSINLSTSEEPASVPDVFATASAFVNAVSKLVFVSPVALVYCPVFFTSSAFSTNCCRECILESRF